MRRVPVVRERVVLDQPVGRVADVESLGMAAVVAVEVAERVARDLPVVRRVARRLIPDLVVGDAPSAVERASLDQDVVRTEDVEPSCAAVHERGAGRPGLEADLALHGRTLDPERGATDGDVAGDREGAANRDRPSGRDCHGLEERARRVRAREGHDTPRPDRGRGSRRGRRGGRRRRRRRRRRRLRLSRGFRLGRRRGARRLGRALRR